MKRLVLFIAFVLPSVVFAQVDWLKRGQSLDEVKGKFPGMERDYGSMSSWVSGEAKQVNVAGRATYIITCDTVKRYEFQSELASGPCEEFPNADSSEVGNLISAARTLYGHYTDIFGTPVVYRQKYLRSPQSGSNEFEVFVAQWKSASEDILIRVYRENPSMNQENAPPPRNKKDPGSCDYSFELKASGNNLRLRSELGLGMTGEQFKAWQPQLADQVQNYPDCWTFREKKDGVEAHWRFQFTQGKLSGYFYDVYAGEEYLVQTDTAYAVLLRQAKAFRAEAVKAYGKPYKDSTDVPEKYKRPKNPNLYYSKVAYLAQWKPGSDFLMIRMNERGGGKQGPPVFHLEIYFGKNE